MANVRRTAIEAGTPYILFSGNVDRAEAFAPLYWDKSAEQRRTTLPQDWKGQPFHHMRLNQDKDTIRLLILHPGIDDDSIICSLEEVGIDEKPYTAVSYQWGDKTPEKKIYILNGGIMTVWPNIYAALKQFRSPVEDKILWVDSICIDQTNMEEKNHQIRLMGKIYGRALGVVTWLGEASEDSDLAMGSLALYSKFLGYYPKDPDMEKLENAQILALGRLFKRGYWNRVWIIQEIAKGGARSWIVCGDKYVAWECIDWFRIMQWRANELFDGSGIGDAAIGEYNEEVFAASLMRDMVKDGAVCPYLSQLLHLSRGRQATQPVDKIYGVLGLASPEIQEALIPDYGKPLREVLVEATKIALKQSQHKQLDLLCEAGHLNENLPSWIPDWTIPLPHRRFMFSAYNASLNTTAEFEIEGEVLKVKALIIDRIGKICSEIFDGTNWRVFRDMRAVASEGLIDMYSHSQSGSIPIRLQNEEMATMRQLAESIHPTFNDCFWRTLCADMDGHSERLVAPQFLTDLQEAIEGGEAQTPGSLVDVYISRTLMKAAFPVLQDRRFFVTDKRHLMGIGPKDLRHGDCVAIIFNASVPFVLRLKSDSTYRLIGPLYINSIMDGQVVSYPGDLKIEEISIT
jgi:hypothetical protein